MMPTPRNTRKPRIQLAARPTAPAPTQSTPKNLMKNLDEVLQNAKAMCDKYEGRYSCILKKDDLYEIITRANNETGKLAIDTETTGLDVFTDQTVGFSVFTKGLKAAYIPLRHLSRFTGKIDENQMKVEDAQEVFAKLNKNVRLEYANAQFDLLGMKYSLGIDLRDNPKDDTLIAARLLNTERKDNNLKDLHAEYCGGTRGPRFAELFKPGTFNLCPPHLGYVYAARDAEMTDELMDQLWIEFKSHPELQWVYENIELPLINVLMRMRERGVLVDEAMRAELTAKYRVMMRQAEKDIEAIYAPYIPKIRQYQCSPAFYKPRGKIQIPVQLTSNDQLAVLLWDIMGLPHGEDRKVDKAKLKALNNDIGNALLNLRQCSKLLSTYLEGLDKFIRPDGCVRGEIKQIGADTGRTSARNPNMQNIPSHNREIRQLYRARPGYMLISCDYSAQEPRLTACIAKDEKMIKAYQEGKDLYSLIASLAFNTTYEECREYHPDGSLYPEGKERRGSAKTIVLGITYGRQIPSIAEQLNCTVEEAQAIYDKVIENFPGLKLAQDEALEEAHKLGYVKDLWGRRRHFKAMMHEDYEFEYAPGCNPEFDPFNPDANALSTEVSPELCKKYRNDLSKIRYWRDKADYIERLKSEYGIITTDYTRIKADLTRKLLNAKVQGSAASLSKLAMIRIDADERLKAHDCHMLLMVHDEVICEAPEKYTKQCGEWIAEDMMSCGGNLPVPFKADCDIYRNWYREVKEEELLAMEEDELD